MGSVANTIDVLLSPYRDAVTAKGFVQLAVAQAGHHQLRASMWMVTPRVHVNNVLSSRTTGCVKKRVVASQCFGQLEGAVNTIAEYEAMNIIRKGQLRWLPKTDSVGQARFVERTVGLAA